MVSMASKITRPILRRELNAARCELIEAKARAARSLARLHKDDAAWLAWLAKDHYTTALKKWAEYLAAEGEEREVSRFEFLTNLKVWLEFLPLPFDANSNSYRRGELYIIGFFGEDSFMVSQDAFGKRYRLLTDTTRPRRNDPYLRYPGAERFLLADGDGVVRVVSSEEGKDRLVCLHNALVILAVTGEDGFRFSFVGSNEKMSITPKSLQNNLGSFTGITALIERLKFELKNYGDIKIDAAAAVAPQAKPKKPRPQGTSILDQVNASLLDDVDPTETAPAVRADLPLADTEIAQRHHKLTPHIAGGQRQADTTRSGRSKGNSQRITSRDVHDSAAPQRSDPAAAALSKADNPLLAGLTDVLDSVDPLAVQPSFRRPTVKGSLEVSLDEMAQEADTVGVRLDAQTELAQVSRESADTPKTQAPSPKRTSSRVITRFALVDEAERRKRDEDEPV